jgi:hypothetical protein
VLARCTFLQTARFGCELREIVFSSRVRSLFHRSLVLILALSLYVSMHAMLE